jgi:AcrR family transcriptional regulator
LPARAVRSRGRRAALGTDRRLRDAERSRQQILEAALSEFAEKGFAGARVRSIAERAGVNSQLISYYFGGKGGLYQEIMERWHDQEAQITQQIERGGRSFAELVSMYVQAMHARPEMARIFVWDGLTRTSPVPAGPSGAGSEAQEVADLRRRQASGEIVADLDPAYLLIALMGAALAPVSMPQQIEHLCGARPDSQEFADKFAEQIELILGHLRGPRPLDAPGAG